VASRSGLLALEHCFVVFNVLAFFSWLRASGNVPQWRQTAASREQQRKPLRVA
jgi:hypothetical protein